MTATVPLSRRAKRSRQPRPSTEVGAAICLVEANAVSRSLLRMTASRPCCHLATWESAMSKWGRLYPRKPPILARAISRRMVGDSLLRCRARSQAETLAWLALTCGAASL